MNLALGRAGILLGALASIAGAVTIAVGAKRQRPYLLRVGRRYAWLVLGAAILAAGK